MYHAFGLDVLLRGVRTRQEEEDPIGKEEGAGINVVEFSTIVTWNVFDSGG